MKYCSRCRAYLDDGYSSCPYCGSTLQVVPSSYQAPTPHVRVKYRVALQGVSRNFAFTGSYDAVELGMLDVDSAIRVFQALPTAYPYPGGVLPEEEDMCPVHMLIYSDRAILSISLLKYNEYYIRGTIEPTDQDIDVSDKASWYDAIDAIRSFYTDPYYLDRLASPKSGAETFSEEREDVLLRIQVEVSAPSSYEYAEHRTSIVTLTRSELAGIPLTDIIKVELSKGIWGATHPSMKIEYYDEQRGKKMRKYVLSKREEVPTYFQVLSMYLPGRVRMK